MNKTKSLVLCAMFIALGMVLPFLTGQIPEIGSQLSPMHFPVYLCGMVVGGKAGLLCGFILPLLRSVTLGMPPIIPATCMAFEMATYGFVAGELYKKRKMNIYLSLIISMICGRLIWGVASYLIYTSMGNPFSFMMFINGALLSAVPGIIAQLVIVPILVKAIKKVAA